MTTRLRGTNYGQTPAPPTVDVEQLKADLQEKAMALMSVQRNYETMSRMMQMKQQELDRLKSAYDNESARGVSLGIQLEEAHSRAARAEATAAKLGPLQEQLEALKATHQKLQYEASLASGRATTSLDKLASMQKLAEDAEFKTAALRRERDAWATSEASLKGEAERLRAQLASAQADAKALASELRTSRDTNVAAREAAHAMDAKQAALQASLMVKDDTIQSLQDQIRGLHEALNESKSSQRTAEVALATARGQHAVAEGQLRSMARSLELSQELSAGHERRVADLGAQLEHTKAAHAASEARAEQLSNLLLDAEDRYQTMLSQGMEAGEAVTRLQVQIASYKAMAADAKRQLSEATAVHEEELEVLRGQSEGAQAAASEAVYRATQSRKLHAEFLGTLLPRVDRAMSGLTQLQSAVVRGLGHLVENTERTLGALGQRLSIWDGAVGELEDAVVRMGRALRALSSAVLSKSAAGAMDAATSNRLRERVTAMEGLLAAEQGSKAALATAKARGESAASEALAAVRTAAEERVAAERARLGARLSSLEAEVARLQAACDADRAAAAQMLHMEREDMARTVAAARAGEEAAHAEVERMRGEVALANKDALAALNRVHAAEAEKMIMEHSAKVIALEDQLLAGQANITASWEVASRLLADMGIVGVHLAKMGWDIKQAEPGAVQAMGQDDGSGAVLVKASQLLRLHFSYITEAVQNMARKPPPAQVPVQLPAAPSQDWSAIRRELRTTVAKLIHVEEALATSCTCMLCLEVLKQPLTCTPCGHTYCKRCLEKHGNLCAECGDACITGAVENTPLESICSKYEFKLSALQSIQRAVGQ